MSETYRVEVRQVIEVTIDPAKFNEAFMEEFRESFYPFDTVVEHVEHIAQLQARGLIDATAYSGDFIEGYGPSLEMGIVAEDIETDMEVIEGPKAGTR